MLSLLLSCIVFVSCQELTLSLILGSMSKGMRQRSIDHLHLSLELSVSLLCLEDINIGENTAVEVAYVQMKDDKEFVVLRNTDGWLVMLVG